MSRFRLNSIQGFDAFGKTLDDVKVRTSFGGVLSLVSLLLIVILTIGEWNDYRRVTMKPVIAVDNSRGAKLYVNFNITFPRVPCYLLSLDIIDISGERQDDVQHDIAKTRVSSSGKFLDHEKSRKLEGDAAELMVKKQKPPGYCGSCYGGLPPTEGPNPGCCNTCQEVRDSYQHRGWSFQDPDGVEQCKDEGWADMIREQADEGCNIDGHLLVNKVIGSLHFSPGKTFQANGLHMYQLVPYTQAHHRHDFGHEILDFSFSTPSERAFIERPKSRELWQKKKKALNMIDPLNGLKAHTEESNYMFQYFLKVVSTSFTFLKGEQIQSHQYSVTMYERNLDQTKATSSPTVSHGAPGIPGVYFNYEFSPLQVRHSETHETFMHFLTSTVAVIGGVLTVASVVDFIVYSGGGRFSQATDMAGLSRDGKFM